MRFLTSGFVLMIICLLVFSFFSLSKCDYCHGVLFNDVINIGKHNVHPKCYLALATNSKAENQAEMDKYVEGKLK